MNEEEQFPLEESSTPEPDTSTETPDESTIEESPADSSPSQETQELQLVNQKIDSIIEIISLEPSTDQHDELILINEKFESLLEYLIQEPTPEELEDAENQQLNALTYEETTLENSDRQIELLEEISTKLSTFQTTSEEQFLSYQEMNENQNLHATDLTLMLIFALAISMGFKIFTENLIKW